MSYLEPLTIQWIVAVVKHYYTSLRDIECQIEVANGELALLKGQIFEVEGQIEGNVPIIQAQEETIKIMEDWIDEAGRTFQYPHAFPLRASRVGNVSAADVVYPEDMIVRVENGAPQRFIDPGQLDGERKDSHDSDSCYLCMEEAKSDS